VTAVTAVTGLRLLVLDAYAPEGRAAVRGAGGTEAGRLYERMLRTLTRDAVIDVAYPADPDPQLPSGVALTDYDGICWTGSSLTIYQTDDVRVRRQLEFARAVYDAGLPSFGSCWAAQLAVAAVGGRCAASPKGREFGVARHITLTAAGREHPLYRGKPSCFTAFTSHADEVVDLCDGAQLLASNAWSAVQAVAVERGRGRFWALQYHPEYDPHEVAALCRIRKRELIGQGTFTDDAAADAYIAQLEALHADPTRADLAAELGIDADLIDPEQRTLEVRNWLASLEATDPGRARSRRSR
jgi:GMP synthase (glutamine-hydrolysing)